MDGRKVRDYIVGYIECGILLLLLLAAIEKLLFVLGVWK